jgi:uncharacterized protein (DUF433 family)
MSPGLAERLIAERLIDVKNVAGTWNAGSRVAEVLARCPLVTSKVTALNSVARR